MTDARVELVRTILDDLPIRPAQHDLDAASVGIVAALDVFHNHDGRFTITFSDETEPDE